MKLKFLALSLFLALMTVGCSSQPHEPKISIRVEHQVPTLEIIPDGKVVKIEVTDYRGMASGTGFYARYEKKIYLVTAAHVIDYDSNLGKVWKERDVALLEVVGYTGKFYELSTVRAKEIYAIGYAYGNDLFRIDANITGEGSCYCEAKEVWFTDNMTKPGMSGGPMIDKKTGKVVGLVHGFIESKRVYTGVFVKAKAVIEMIKKLERK